MKADDHSPLQKAGVGVAIALCLYVGLYVILSKPEPHEVTYNRFSGIVFIPTYKMGGRSAEIIFWPLQKLDQRLFPKRWSLSLPEVPLPK